MSTVGDARQMVLTSQLPPAPPMASSVPGGGGPGGGIGVADAWRIIKQRKLLIVITFCVAYLLVVAATFLIWRFVPAYPAEAYVKLSPPSEKAYALNEPVVPKEYVEQQIQTEVARIKGFDALMDLLAQPEIKDTSFYRWYGDDFMRCVYDLRDMLSVAPVRDSYLIRVYLAVRDREEATLIVNTLVQRYLASSRSERTEIRARKLEALRSTQAKAQEQLDETRRRISELRTRRDMPGMEAEEQVLIDVVSMLNNTRAELLARIADIEVRLATIGGLDPRKLPLSAEMKLIVETDPVLRYYRQQVEALDIQIDVWQKNRIGENHREMQLLRDQRYGYFQKEVDRREELIEDLRARQIEALQQELARMRGLLVEIQGQLTERQNAQRDLAMAMQQLQGLLQDEVRYQGELQLVSVAAREAQHQHDVQREGRLVTVGLAREAVWPSRPNFIVYLGGGFVLSLLVAVGMAFLREFTDQALRTPIDVARHGQLSVLGCVPLLDDEEADIEELEFATRRAPHSLVAEAFRQIRAHLTFSGPLESQRTLLITSPSPEDGKTATAINLAVTFAQANQRVLLVDCNFRRPGIRRAFPTARNEGLSNILVGRGKFEEVVSQTELPNLDVLTSGPMPPNPAELLASPPMRGLLEAAKAKYDRVILDGPPCLLISDALLVATQVDAVVMVARAGSNSKGALRRAREQLQRINGRVIGAVLNGVEARPGGYYRDQYREFYEYTNEEQFPPELPEGPPEIDAGQVSGAEDSDRRS